jgi:transposase
MFPTGGIMANKEELLVIRSDEVDRYQVVRKSMDRVITQREAAEYLGLSNRQVRRIIRRVRTEGRKGVIHRLRGQAGCHQLSSDLKKRVLSLYQSQYPDFGPTLASEKLEERNKIKVNHETLRLWLIKAGLWKVQRHYSKRKKLTWRERKGHLGEMIQMDGSHHEWLEKRGPKLVLMGYIDDATSKYFGRFYDHEGTHPAMKSLWAYIKQNGIPLVIYLDKHSTYKINRPEKDYPFKSREELTQFGRACKQLGIRLIFAHSPQAKGRIERSFETHQDRLVKELRLEGAKTCKDADKVLERKYLDQSNAKFQVPAQKTGDLHRKIDPSMRLDEILSVQTPHALRSDRTVTHSKKWYQILPDTRLSRVTVHEHMDGRLTIRGGSKILPYKQIKGPILRPKPVLTNLLGKPRKARPLPPGPKSYWRKSMSTVVTKHKIGHF